MATKSTIVVSLASLFLAAAPVAAAQLQQGDILYLMGSSLLRYDPDTGAREVISGCSVPMQQCVAPGVVIGTGQIWNVPFAALPQPDGSIVLIAGSNEFQADIALRIDPATGNRTVINHNNDGGLPFSPLGNSVVPFFSPSVASLPSWGVALAIGLFVGLNVRRIRSDQSALTTAQPSGS